MAAGFHGWAAIDAWRTRLSSDIPHWLDVIGEYLTEVNVTSPTCMVEIVEVVIVTQQNRIEVAQVLGRD